MECGSRSGRLDNRLGNLSFACEHRGQAARSAATAGDLAHGRDIRALRRVDARRDRRRASAYRRSVRLHSRGVGKAPCLSFRLGRARAHPRRRARRDLHDLFRVLHSRSRLRSASGAVQHLRPLRRGRGDSPHGHVQLCRHQMGLAGSEHHHAGEDRRTCRDHCPRDHDWTASDRRSLHARSPGREFYLRALWTGARVSPLGLRRLG